jgi:hypothetical protein
MSLPLRCVSESIGCPLSIRSAINCLIGENTDASTDGAQPGQPLSHGSKSIVVVAFSVPALARKPPGTSTDSQSHCAPKRKRRGVHYLVHLLGLKSGNWHRQSLSLATASTLPCAGFSLSRNQLLLVLCTGANDFCLLYPCSPSDPAGQRRLSRHPCRHPPPGPVLIGLSGIDLDPWQRSTTSQMESLQPMSPSCPRSIVPSMAAPG